MRVLLRKSKIKKRHGLERKAKKSVSQAYYYRSWGQTPPYHMYYVCRQTRRLLSWKTALQKNHASYVQDVVSINVNPCSHLRNFRMYILYIHTWEVYIYFLISGTSGRSFSHRGEQIKFFVLISSVSTTVRPRGEEKHFVPPSPERDRDRNQSPSSLTKRARDLGYLGFGIWDMGFGDGGKASWINNPWDLLSCSCDKHGLNH